METRERVMVAIVAVALVAAACGAPETPSIPSMRGAAPSASTLVGHSLVPTPRQPSIGPHRSTAIEAALVGASAFVVPRLPEVRRVELGFFDYFWRRWSVPGLGSARTLIAAAPRPTDRRVAILSRISDPDVRLMARHRTDGHLFEYDVMATAMHCDERTVPDDFVAQVVSASQAGTYEQSHAAYAVVWTRELGCRVPGLEAVARRMATTLAHGLSGETVSDDGLQVSAALTYLGRADLVPMAWIDAVLAAQQPDGGWAPTLGEATNWHTTGLAIWTLAAVRSPGHPVPMILPR